MSDRDDSSHIREDGHAKITYATREEAAKAANLVWSNTGKPQAPYLCGQRPDHWHVGSGTPDIKQADVKR